jgi:hypothetical protein
LLLSAGTNAQTPITAPTNAVSTTGPLRPIGPGLFELGQVRLDKRQRTVSFPSVLNMNEGLVEYLVVTPIGKTHESLLRTEAEPYQIHLAMLLLGAKGAGTNSLPEDARQPLPGDKVIIELTWTNAPAPVRVEDLIYNRLTKSPTGRGHWSYTGSRTAAEGFAAQQSGSIVALITDADALINNPRPGRDNDEIWEVRVNRVPALDTPIQVTIRLDGDTGWK